MLLIPAIDLKDGQCVRLKQGVMDDATVFSDDPVKVAAHWRDQGARRLHLVDLNGAFAGKPKNLAVIRDILAEVGDDMPVQLGGGIRDLDTIEKYLDMGLQYVIIGTAAVKTPGFLHDACDAFPNQVIVGLDAKDGKVATDGWAKITHHDVIDLARRFQDYGVVSVIYTDVARDGMMSGPNIELLREVASRTDAKVTASGGISKLDDLRNIKELAELGVDAAILGKSLYARAFTLEEALEVAR